jgi:hypothetical protein
MLHSAVIESLATRAARYDRDMPIDPSPVVACAATWTPSRKWADTIRGACSALDAGATGLAAADAWATLAMMAGDTRAAPLALIVCLHAETELPAGVEHRTLPGHRALCLLDLGLATPTAPGPIRIVDLGAPSTLHDAPGPLAAWLARALVPFDGDLARAARYVHRIVALRTGLADGPDPDP